MNKHSSEIFVEDLFELTPLNLKIFIKNEISVLDFYLTNAKCKFEYNHIKAAIQGLKELSKLLDDPAALFTEKSLEDILNYIYETKNKIEGFYRIKLAN